MKYAQPFLFFRKLSYLIKMGRGVHLLETLKQVNSSLPFDEINKLIERYRKEGAGNMDTL
jgi:hypothetical protein